MERPISKPIGTPAEELDTPSLVVDMSVLERNIETMHSFFRDRDAKLRPHVASHCSPAVAHRQLEAGGTVGGICVSTIGQAEVFAASGIADIFVAHKAVTEQKIDRLCALARGSRMTVAVDSQRNVGDLSEAATTSGVDLRVVVEINAGQDTGGVEPGRPAVELAGIAQKTAGLEFAGFMCQGEPTRPEGGPRDDSEFRQVVQQVLDTRQMAESEGMEVSVVSVGGTETYDIAGGMSGVTEVLAGYYPLMDHGHRSTREEFQPAARVITTVSSLPEPSVAITDGGAKSIGGDTGDPSVDNVPGAQVRGLSAEHASLDLGPSAQAHLELGDKVWFTPWNIAECVNLHDYLHCVRDGRLEAVWNVAARGHYR